jgi:hypothetical protein
VEVCIESEKIRIEFNKDSEYISLPHIFLAILRVCEDIKVLFEKEGLRLKEFIEEVNEKSMPKRITPTVSITFCFITFSFINYLRTQTLL